MTKSRGGNDRGLKIFNSLVASYDGDVELALSIYSCLFSLCCAVDELVGLILDAVDQSLSKAILSLYSLVTTVGALALKIMFIKIPFGKKAHVFHSLFEHLVLLKRAQMANPLGRFVSNLIELCDLNGDTRRNEQGALLDGTSLVP